MEASKRLIIKRALIFIFTATGAAFLSSCSSPHSSVNFQNGSKPTTSTSVPLIAQLPDGGRNLGSLTNYSYTNEINGIVAFQGEVHSPTDWEITSPATILYVGTSSYTKLGNTWYPAKANADAYAQASYEGTVETFLGMSKVYGASIQKAGSCSQAGQSGHIYVFQSHSGTAIHALASACIADSSGVLLSYSLGVSSPDLSGGGHSIADSFAINSIGNISEITPPSNAG